MKVNNASFVRSVENGLNQKFDKLFFNEYDILEDLFIRYFASYIKQYRHPGYNVYFNAVQVNTNGNNSDNNAENSAENNEVIYQRLKVYKGRLSRMEILEILDLFRKGLLVQSAIFSQIFTKLCYKDTDIEAATMCVKCRKLFANSKSARTSHREHIKWHANNPEGDVIIPVTLKTLLIDCLADMISKDVFPFTVIEKPGFVNVLNTVFQRAFEYGLENGMNGNIPSVTPSIHDFLPCPNTLRNHVDSIVTTLTPEFSNYVKHHVETYGAAVSFDFTEKNSPYYVVTIHFLTKDW
uniref:C2H2-type domain-containing protein n=1 Tax=Panagrolaimus davidi TaxID=227884 RepID=A0A914Q2D1_9BILA